MNKLKTVLKYSEQLEKTIINIYNVYNIWYTNKAIFDQTDEILNKHFEKNVFPIKKIINGE